MSLKIDRTESAIKNMARSITKSKVEEKRKSYEEQRRNAAKKRQRCKMCIYRAYHGRGCDYILITGERRGCKPEDASIITATTEYGEKLTAAVAKDNVMATQFHPEKSGDVGLQVLKNFIEM